MPKSGRAKYLVPAIKRCMDVIELLAHEDQGMTISDLHRTLKLPLSSTAAILYTLETLGYIDKDPGSFHYQIGFKLQSLAQLQTDRLDIPARCHGILQQLARETGLTSHIAVARDGEAMYIDRIAGSGLIQFSSYIGMRWQMHASGVGKALLAFLPEEELANILKYLPLTRLTTHTTISKAQFLKQLREFRKLGYTYEIGEGEEGVVCVAAPVLGPNDAVVCAASVTGTVHQIPDNAIPDLGITVRRFADQMAARLGSRKVEDEVAANPAGKTHKSH